MAGELQTSSRQSVLSYSGDIAVGAIPHVLILLKHLTPMSVISVKEKTSNDLERSSCSAIYLLLCISCNNSD